MKKLILLLSLFIVITGCNKEEKLKPEQEQEQEQEQPGDDPGDDPSDDSGDDSGDDPGDDPGDNPGDDPGDNPGDDPGDDPGVEPNHVAAWRTTTQYFSRTIIWVFPESETETIKEMVETESSVDVSGEESYRLAFNEDETGFGSSVCHDGNGRYDFDFTWKLSEDNLTIKRTKPGYGGVLFEYGGFARHEVRWEIEELTADKMVLSRFPYRVEDRTYAVWLEADTCRYTFLKEK
jgi:hypothetical protein